MDPITQTEQDTLFWLYVDEIEDWNSRMCERINHPGRTCRSYYKAHEDLFPEYWLAYTPA